MPFCISRGKLTLVWFRKYGCWARNKSIHLPKRSKGVGWCSADLETAQRSLLEVFLLCSIFPPSAHMRNPLRDKICLLQQHCENSVSFIHIIIFQNNHCCVYSFVHERPHSEGRKILIYTQMIIFLESLIKYGIDSFISIGYMYVCVCGVN